MNYSELKRLIESACIDPFQYNDFNLVAIVGRKTAEYMERDAAIRFYTEAVAATDGSEQSRYANVLSALKAGEQIVNLY